MTETEKRYSKTEKDALTIQSAKERLRIYLLGAPRFRIVTAHKPLIPLFNKLKTKVPSRIEKRIMEMRKWIMSLCKDLVRVKQTPKTTFPDTL